MAGHGPNHGQMSSQANFRPRIDRAVPASSAGRCQIYGILGLCIALGELRMNVGPILYILIIILVILLIVYLFQRIR